MTRLWRLAGVGALLLSLVGAWNGAQHHAAMAASPRADSPITNIVPATRVVVFHPAGTNGKVVSGSCAMGESQALDRADAWRCIVGNEIYDPCFSAAPHATSVICDVSPQKPIGFTVKLPGPLPTHAPAHNRQVWMMQLGNGILCGFLTGATGGIAGQRINYGCTDKTVVLGDPSPGRVWYAVVAQLSGKAGPTGPAASRIWAVSVAVLWK